MKETNIYSQFASILSETKWLLENEEFEVYRYNSEKNPIDFNLKWKPIFKESSKITSNLLMRPKEIEKNFSCKLCPKKLGAIRKFKSTGLKPILVLHYTGEYRKGHSTITKLNPNLKLRTRESEDLFDRLIKKVFGISSSEFHFQEYPACTFNHNNSNSEDWTARMDACDLHVKETIQTEGIKGIILMGSAAVLRLGMELAKEKTGKVESFVFGDIELPGIVIRSPEGVFSLEEKRKKLERDKSTNSYRQAKQEEDEVKLSLVEHLTEFKNFIGLI